MAIEPRRLALALAGFQAIDAVACAIPLSNLKAELDRLGCPPAVQRAIPILKGVSAAGLVAGLKHPRLGELTAAAMVGYFVAALGFHARAGDRPLQFAPAAAILTWSALALGGYRRTAE